MFRCLFSGKTPTVLNQSLQIAKDKTNLNRIYTDLAISYPNGFIARKSTDHRMSDYFDDIKITNNESYLSINFKVKENVSSSFWKDLVVDVCRSVELAGMNLIDIQKD